MGTLKAFAARHGLPDHYLQQASIWFDPLVESLISHQDGAGRPVIIGLHGCQGSGKTTLADYLRTSLTKRGIPACSISLDDFYLTKQQRIQLAEDVHPMFRTRGVPGTHDIELALATLDHLITPISAGDLLIPRFDKASDDRAPQSDWLLLDTPPKIIILEGWCLATPPEETQAVGYSLNELEKTRDPDGVWRRYVNRQLSNEYAQLWQRLDQLVMLQAPSFSCVYQWRLEQEHKLRIARDSTHQNSSDIMTDEQVFQFIQHYERLTRHALKVLPSQCQHLFQLNSKRMVVGYQGEKINSAKKEAHFG